MKKYIETKQIEAEPMTLGDFVQETGRNPYGKDIENHKETEKGYRVKYEDGYESWSPAKAFEKSYKCADTFLDRLHIEMKDLYDRLDKLVAFIDSGKMDEVVTDNYQKFLLRLQQVVMYNPKNEKTVLEKRKRKVRPGRRKNENGKFPDTHTKKRQRLNVNKTVFKRCFFIEKSTQKVIVNSEKICIFT